jgi:hypothetical protein
LQTFCERLGDYLPRDLYRESLHHGHSHTFGFAAYFVPLTARPDDPFWDLREFIRATSPRWFSRAQVLQAPTELPAWQWPDWPQPYFHLGLIQVLKDLQAQRAFGSLPAGDSG